MENLVRHLVAPLVAHPDAISLKTIEGDDVVLLEMVVHADDREVFEGANSETLRSVRSVLSAAAGSRKASLELVEEHGAEGEE